MRCSCCQKELIKNLTLLELFFQSSHRCFHCQQLFTVIEQKVACPGCGRPNSVELCGDCLQWQKQVGFVLENRGLFYYDAGFRKWIEDYKFTGDYRLRGAFTTELNQALKNYRDYLICPMPLSMERFATRGFNQVSSCLELTNPPFHFLLARKELAPQSEKTRAERLKMEQPFTVKVPKEKIRNQRVLLVDDVYTTGRTLVHGAELLYQNGVKTVKTLTFAR